jgi:predicted RNA-binding Zn-ribbon protein involved in translation (DUF1610 family)
MTYIRGLLTDKQTDDLVGAGYELMVVGPSPGGLLDVLVFVDVDVNDLLSPPLCGNCGALMDYDYFPGQEDGVTLYVCPNCGEQVRRWTSR